MIKTVESLPIEKILGKDNNSNELFYKIPPYQREYAWGKSQWENLFDDIKENDRRYFLGSIICISKNNELEVVDGQQRLTTLSLLLNALLYTINDYNKSYPEERILDLSLNEEFATNWSILKKLLYDKNANTAKLTLSMQNQNNDDYTYILKENSLVNSANKPSNFGNRRISRAYEYFKGRLKEVDNNGNPLFSIDEIYEFLNKVFSALLVKIEVENASSAFILFESINNRGIPLTPIDLIKNSIIGEMEKKGTKPEDTNKQWQTLIENIESYEDQVRFLRHYYHAFQCCNDKVKLSPFTKATKSNIIKIYSEPH